MFDRTVVFFGGLPVCKRLHGVTGVVCRGSQPGDDFCCLGEYLIHLAKLIYFLGVVGLVDAQDIYPDYWNAPNA